VKVRMSNTLCLQNVSLVNSDKYAGILRFNKNQGEPYFRQNPKTGWKAFKLWLHSLHPPRVP
jgi:hypothetical protein